MNIISRQAGSRPGRERDGKEAGTPARQMPRLGGGHGWGVITSPVP